MSEGEVEKVLLSDERKFAQVMRLIKFIDRDNNGYVTVSEIDDIIKL
jgi:hypothetical protein